MAADTDVENGAAPAQPRDFVFQIRSKAEKVRSHYLNTEDVHIGPVARIKMWHTQEDEVRNAIVREQKAFMTASREQQDSLGRFLTRNDATQNDANRERDDAIQDILADPLPAGAGADAELDARSKALIREERRALAVAQGAQLDQTLMAPPTRDFANDFTRTVNNYHNALRAAAPENRQDSKYSFKAILTEIHNERRELNPDKANEYLAKLRKLHEDFRAYIYSIDIKIARHALIPLREDALCHLDQAYELAKQAVAKYQDPVNAASANVVLPPPRDRLNPQPHELTQWDRIKFDFEKDCDSHLRSSRNRFKFDSLHNHGEAVKRFKAEQGELQQQFGEELAAIHQQRLKGFLATNPSPEKIAAEMARWREEAMHLAFAKIREQQQQAWMAESNTARTDAEKNFAALVAQDLEKHYSRTHGPDRRAAAVHGDTSNLREQARAKGQGAEIIVLRGSRLGLIADTMLLHNTSIRERGFIEGGDPSQGKIQAVLDMDWGTKEISYSYDEENDCDVFNLHFHMWDREGFDQASYNKIKITYESMISLRKPDGSLNKEWHFCTRENMSKWNQRDRIKIFAHLHAINNAKGLGEIVKIYGYNPHTDRSKENRELYRKTYAAVSKHINETTELQKSTIDQFKPKFDNVLDVQRQEAEAAAEAAANPPAASGPGARRT